MGKTRSLKPLPSSPSGSWPCEQYPIFLWILMQRQNLPILPAALHTGLADSKICQFSPSRCGDMSSPLFPIALWKETAVPLLGCLQVLCTQQCSDAVTKKINIYDCLLGNSMIYSSHPNTFNVYMGSSGKYNLCMCLKEKDLNLESQTGLYQQPDTCICKLQDEATPKMGLL